MPEPILETETETVKEIKELQRISVEESKKTQELLKKVIRNLQVFK